MTPTQNVLLLNEVVYNAVRAVFDGQDGTRAVKLENGGVIVTATNGDHVSVYVQSCHFEPGEAVPF